MVYGGNALRTHSKPTKWVMYTPTAEEIAMDADLPRWVRERLHVAGGVPKWPD